jgi:hypothetical protein
LPNPDCTVGGLATPQDVAASSTINGALANDQGVVSWFLTCYGTDDLNTVAAVNATLSVNVQARTFSFTSGIPGSCYVFQSTVGVGSQSQQGYGFDANNVLQSSYTTTFKVNVPLADGLRVISKNESFEQDPVNGVLSEINAAIRAEDAVGLQNNGVTLAGGPFTTLNLEPGLAATNAGGGIANVTASAGWQTAFDIDFTAQPSQSLAADGPYTIGGQVFTKINSTGDRSAMVLSATGVVINPASSTQYSGSPVTRTLPALTWPLSTIPAITWGTPLRLTARVVLANAANQFDNFILGVDSGSALYWSWHVMYGQNGGGTGIGQDVLIIQSGNNGSQAIQNDAARASDDVHVIELQQGAPSLHFRTFSGVYPAGFPTMTGLRPRVLYVEAGLILSAGPDFSNFEVIFGAKEVGSGDATFSCTVKRLKVEYHT